MAVLFAPSAMVGERELDAMLLHETPLWSFSGDVSLLVMPALGRSEKASAHGAMTATAVTTCESRIFVRALAEGMTVPRCGRLGVKGIPR